MVLSEVTREPSRLFEEHGFYHADLSVKCDVEEVGVDFKCVADVEHGFYTDSFLAGKSVYSLLFHIMLHERVRKLLSERFDHADSVGWGRGKRRREKKGCGDLQKVRSLCGRRRQVKLRINKTKQKVRYSEIKEDSREKCVRMVENK